MFYLLDVSFVKYTLQKELMHLHINVVILTIRL